MKLHCFLGIHFWNTVKEKHKVTDHPNGREYVRIVVRECEDCGKRQYRRIIPTIFGYRWKKCTFNKNSEIKFSEVNK